MKALQNYLVAVVAFATLILGASFYWWHSNQIAAIRDAAFSAGQNECRQAVEAVKNAVLAKANADIQEKERDFNRRLLEAQQAIKLADERAEGLRAVAKGQHEELNAQADSLQCIIPDATIDTLNRPIKIGASPPPPAAPKKEVGSKPPAPAAPTAPPKGGDLPAFLQLKK